LARPNIGVFLAGRDGARHMGTSRGGAATQGPCYGPVSVDQGPAMTDDVTKDSNGNILADGDSVTLIKDLKVKGSGGVTLKRGTLVKNIRLTGDTDEIEANVDKVRGLVLRVEFVKKA
jgi:protein PhnA